MAAFWDVATCSLVDVDRRFRRTYCFHHQGHVLKSHLKVETECFSETLVSTYESASRHNPEQNIVSTSAKTTNRLKLIIFIFKSVILSICSYNNKRSDSSDYATLRQMMLCVIADCCINQFLCPSYHVLYPNSIP
jgi:hypothetical protein